MSSDEEDDDDGSNAGEAANGFEEECLRIHNQNATENLLKAGLRLPRAGRMERNEVEKPHGKTLQAVARRLGVDTDQIESY